MVSAGKGIFGRLGMPEAGAWYPNRCKLLHGHRCVFGKDGTTAMPENVLNCRNNFSIVYTWIWAALVLLGSRNASSDQYLQYWTYLSPGLIAIGKALTCTHQEVCNQLKVCYPPVIWVLIFLIINGGPFKQLQPFPHKWRSGTTKANGFENDLGGCHFQKNFTILRCPRCQMFKC